MIDFPQAVDLLQNPHGFDLLHHDVITMTTWFTRKGVAVRRRGALRRAPRGGVLMAHLAVVPAQAGVARGAWRTPTRRSPR